MTEHEKAACVAIAEQIKAKLSPKELDDLRRSLDAQGLLKAPRRKGARR